ncbi:MAG: type VI secretion system tube protein Hcp [Pirellulales bacterium]
MAIYVKLGDIEGSAIDKKHLNWLDVQTVNFGMHLQKLTARTQSDLGFGPLTVNDLQVTREVDKASVLIERACVYREAKKVEIHFCHDLEGKGSEQFLKYELENALVTSYSLTGRHEGGRPTESFALNFTKATWTYTETNPKIQSSGQIMAEYDFAAAK